MFPFPKECVIISPGYYETTTICAVAINSLVFTL